MAFTFVFGQNKSLSFLFFWQKEKMDKAIDAVKASFNTVRTGRSNPAMLDRIEVLMR